MGNQWKLEIYAIHPISNYSTGLHCGELFDDFYKSHIKNLKPTNQSPFCQGHNLQILRLGGHFAGLMTALQPVPPPLILIFMLRRINLHKLKARGSTSVIIKKKLNKNNSRPMNTAVIRLISLKD